MSRQICQGIRKRQVQGGDKVSVHEIVYICDHLSLHRDFVALLYSQNKFCGIPKKVSTGVTIIALQMNSVMVHVLAKQCSSQKKNRLFLD